MASTTDTIPARNPQALGFYDLDASILGQSGRRLLREYSGIAEEEINSHVETMRAKAFEVCPYPCIGMFQFLDLSMMSTASYQEILDRVKGGQKFLDLGCCLGQEIRQLVFDGALSENTYGSDLWEGFFPVGYELFKDEDRLRTTFIPADVFDDSSPLTKLSGMMDIVHTGALFHLFGLEQQEQLALRIVQLLAPRPGSMLIGRQSGSEVSGESSRAGDKSGRKSFQHNPQSWAELWARIGEQTGSKWSVEADLSQPEFTMLSQEGKSKELEKKMTAKGLRFFVKRL
ncbi:hypothetical protein GQ53DRAFT_877703 [Thozetella sp. PMI_491]|nr:hypothetical protein GQ53DRAFT_877703 [Thozetella sp. PMI_491]